MYCGKWTGPCGLLGARMKHCENRTSTMRVLSCVASTFTHNSTTKEELWHIHVNLISGLAQHFRFSTAHIVVSHSRVSLTRQSHAQPSIVRQRIEQCNHMQLYVLNTYHVVASSEAIQTKRFESLTSLSAILSVPRPAR